MKSIPLLPKGFRIVGVILLLLGLLSGYLYYFAGKPDFFETNIFAFITSYLETRYWVEAQTNLLDEMAAIFIVSGLTMLIFSKEKNENDEIKILRLKALVYATYFTVIAWIFMFLFIYGWPIFLFSSFIFLIFLIASLIIFKFMKYRNKRLK